MAVYNKLDEEEGMDTLARQAWYQYQGRDESRVDRQERAAILRALREADKRRAEQQKGENDD